MGCIWFLCGLVVSCLGFKVYDMIGAQNKATTVSNPTLLGLLTRQYMPDLDNLAETHNIACLTQVGPF
jgi:hypothetical protein